MKKKYIKKKWDRVFFKGKIHLKESPVKWCDQPDCVHRFIEVKAELDMGYKRTSCPICVPYKHWNRTNNTPYKELPSEINIF